jgi:hypothetical protein
MKDWWLHVNRRFRIVLAFLLFALFMVLFLVSSPITIPLELLIWFFTGYDFLGGIMSKFVPYFHRWFICI